MSTPAGLNAWDHHAPMMLNVHLRPGTRMTWVTVGDRNRVALRVEGTNDAELDMFAGRSELARLIATASEALAAVDARDEGTPAA